MNARWSKVLSPIALGAALGGCSALGTDVAEVGARVQLFLNALPDGSADSEIALETASCRRLTESECVTRSECEPLHAVTGERGLDLEVYLGCHASAAE